MDEQGLKVIVVDNCSTHKSIALREVIEEQGMPHSLLSYPTCNVKQLIGYRLLFLPAYSPDLNPIEESFSCSKLYLSGSRVSFRLFPVLRVVCLIHTLTFAHFTSKHTSASRQPRPIRSDSLSSSYFKMRSSSRSAHRHLSYSHRTHLMLHGPCY